ncbi:uncharacterized protein PAC_16618 [Phialocephala subalpina]|uniref:Uncharacterized protein n=1 Tax=Phialocephala subalpina TaxID=576137 RepID=A0A1L7XP24_9HELO|nr:uncharacterized protein PAC_16618 [Phialocephala subalpina]
MASKVLTATRSSSHRKVIVSLMSRRGSERDGSEPPSAATVRSKKVHKGVERPRNSRKKKKKSELTTLTMSRHLSAHINSTICSLYKGILLTLRGNKFALSQLLKLVSGGASPRSEESTRKRGRAEGETKAAKNWTHLRNSKLRAEESLEAKPSFTLISGRRERLTLQYTAPLARAKNLELSILRCDNPNQSIDKVKSATAQQFTMSNTYANHCVKSASC